VKTNEADRCRQEKAFKRIIDNTRQKEKQTPKTRNQKW
jgi:hypothetical protein